jgi:hypothetical protein
MSACMPEIIRYVCDARMYACMHACVHRCRKLLGSNICVYVCIHVCVCACIDVCMCMYVCVCTYGICMHTCMYVSVCMYVCACMYGYACAWLHVCMYTCTYVRMYVYMHACAWLHVRDCMYTFTYIRMYVYMHACMCECMLGNYAWELLTDPQLEPSSRNRRFLTLDAMLCQFVEESAITSICFTCVYCVGRFCSKPERSDGETGTQHRSVWPPMPENVLLACARSHSAMMVWTIYGTKYAQCFVCVVRWKSAVSWDCDRTNNKTSRNELSFPRLVRDIYILAAMFRRH